MTIESKCTERINTHCERLWKKCCVVSFKTFSLTAWNAFNIESRNAVKNSIQNYPFLLFLCQSNLSLSTMISLLAHIETNLVSYTWNVYFFSSHLTGHIITIFLTLTERLLSFLTLKNANLAQLFPQTLTCSST